MLPLRELMSLPLRDKIFIHTVIIQVSRAMALNGHTAAVVSVSFSQDSKRFVKIVDFPTLEFLLSCFVAELLVSHATNRTLQTISNITT